jgi:LacI family transcriptional regulator
MLARVQRVMDELGYQPNQAARSLKNARTKTIGIIIPSIADPFFAEYASVAESVAREHDYVIMLLTSQDKARHEVNDLHIFERHRVDGLLVAPPRSKGKALLDSLAKLFIPVVAIDRPFASGQYSQVLCDNYSASQRAIRHLMEHGRKRILVLGGDPGLYTIRERTKGCVSVTSSAGLPSFIEMGAADYATAEAAIMKHIKQRGGIDAIFGLYNQSTIHAYQVLQNHNIPVPERVSLIGFDDFELAESLRPSITVVKQAVPEMARAATRLLLSQINSDVVSSQHIEITASLVIRRSCGCSL